MKNVRFTAAARLEFLAEVAYYNEMQPGLGRRFSEAVEAAVASALAFPSSGSPASKNTRQVLLKDFPFTMVYRETATGIIVFALVHHSRRPGYWLPRIQETGKSYRATELR